MHEDGKGQESAWRPYLDILPTTFDTPIFWSMSELEELQACAVRHKIGKEAADGHFVEKLLPIVQTNSAVIGSHDGCSTGPDGVADFVKACHRAATLIFSYGFDLDPHVLSYQEREMEDDDEAADDLKKGMVPLADLFNADGDRNNVSRARIKNCSQALINKAHLIQNENTMTMVAIRAIQSGEQIFNDFGKLPRSDLFRRYGYVTDSYKKWDVVEIPLELITEVAGKHNQLSDGGKEKRVSNSYAKYIQEHRLNMP